MIPLYHDFSDATVLVFGGGPVGARKARRFAREARVIVLSPAFADADFGDARLVRAAPAPADVAAWVERAAPALVVAATDDPAVNDAIAAAAGEEGALVNRADEAGAREVGSVVVPATVRDGPVTVAVSTGGTSPALSGYLRERLTPTIENAGAMAMLSGELRAELREAGVDAERRRAALRAVVRSDRVWTGLDRGADKGRQVAEDVTGETP
ncbi:MAG: bifunctional precorrin-2 dehydrogenase/sirohydrochlorin ferrochelatase [Haloarculaceae archaeon]